METRTASMIFLAATPSSVLFETSSRSMSPVARWQTLYLSLIVGAWVPLPGGGRAGKRGVSQGARTARVLQAGRSVRTSSGRADEDHPELVGGRGRDGGGGILDDGLGRRQGRVDGALGGLLEALDLVVELSERGQGEGEARRQARSEAAAKDEEEVEQQKSARPAVCELPRRAQGSGRAEGDGPGR